MPGQDEATRTLAPCPHCGEQHGQDWLRCSKTDMLLPLEGRRLDAKFRFVTPLGTGGMAAVWLAVNERVDREVAIKFLRPEVGRDPEAVARFRSEARAAGRIGNPHICEILDLGDSPIGPYIVMERLRGIDLAALIKRQGRLAPGYAVRVVRHALQGLAAAHVAGIVHRDLKPGNIFLHRTDAGETVVKLMDFGVSKFLDGTGEAETASGILLGTPEYMAPEQLEGAHKLGPSADIWAMGAILYRAITGQQVFSGGNLAAVIKSMAIDDPVPIDQLVAGLPEGLVAVIHGCLQRDLVRRIPTAEALSEALAPFEELDITVQLLEPAERRRVSAASTSLAVEQLDAPLPVIERAGPAREARPEAAGVEKPSAPAEDDHEASEATSLWRSEDEAPASGPLRPERDTGEVQAQLDLSKDPSSSDSSPSASGPSDSDAREQDTAEAKSISRPERSGASRESVTELMSAPEDRPSRERKARPLATGLSIVALLGVVGWFLFDQVIGAGSSGSKDSSTDTIAAEDRDTYRSLPGEDEPSGGTSTGSLASLDDPSHHSAGEEGPDAATTNAALGGDETDAGETGTNEPGPDEPGPDEPGPTEPGEDETVGDGTDEPDTADGTWVPSTDRPPPPGTIRGGPLVTPTNPGPIGDHRAARDHCESLATNRFAGISQWDLANPAELNHFIDVKTVKPSRYWTSAVWKGKSAVYQLPRGKKSSEKIDKKLARPLCVAHW